MLKAVNLLLISAVIFACSQSKTEETTIEEPTAPAVEEFVTDNNTATEIPADEPAEDNASEADAQDAEAETDNTSAN